MNTEKKLILRKSEIVYSLRFGDQSAPLSKEMGEAIDELLSRNSSPKGPVTLGSLGKELVKSWMLCAHQHGREATESFEVWYKRSEEGIVNSQIKWPVTLTDEEIVEKWREVRQGGMIGTNYAALSLVRWARGEDLEDKR